MRRFVFSIVLSVVVLPATTATACADDATMAPPCAMPIAATLADRPGTGRTTSAGGAPCVALPGEWIVETGVRRQITTDAGGSSTLASGPLTLIRAGVTPRLELAVAPPEPESRAISGLAPVDAARGSTDLVVAAKYLMLDTTRMQGSVGASYSPPTGSGEFTAGAPTFSTGANLALAISARVSLAMSQVAGTAIGADATGRNRRYFVYAPSYTVSYALTGNDTLIVQDAILSRQSPILPAGNRVVLALQHAVGTRLAFDVDLERNLAPTLGTASNAVGAGVVWIVEPGRARHQNRLSP
jgi:hypothetical protein